VYIFTVYCVLSLEWYQLVLRTSEKFFVWPVFGPWNLDNRFRQSLVHVP